MKIDTFIKCGTNHNMCEDYILSGIKPVPYIIISDGCSSSDDTETGARILAHLAKQYIYQRKDYLKDLDKNEMGQWIANNAEMTAKHLGLQSTCLDATLIVAYEVIDNIRVVFFGDGFVYAVTRESAHLYNTLLDEVIYTNNAPYYLSYKIDPYRDALYHQMGNSVTWVTKYKDPGREVDEICFAYDQPLGTEFRIANYKSVFISSDGLGSFLMPKEDNPSERIKLDPMELMETHFSAFKNTSGEFLKRRCKRAIKRFENDGVFHYDDFSIGAFLPED